jgi:MFS family permease
MGWTKPFVLVCLIGGVAVLAVFVVVEHRVAEPMFRLELFRSRPFTMGNLSALLTALARGGLQFMLIIWLQGIWLPQHGYSFERTPLWAGIYLVPLTVGSLLAGPVSGRLADRFGARPFATAGALLSGVVFLLFNLLPMDFPYVPFAVLLFLIGLSIGMFMAPNTSSVMNSLPADQRGGGAGMLNTFQNSASVLSIGVFFTIITLGLAGSLPHALSAGLSSHGVPAAQAQGVAALPPIGLLFASFLGFNPVQQLLPSASAAHVSPAHYQFLTGRGFFPDLISSPFGHGLHLAFLMAAVLCFFAAIFSWLRGRGTGHVQQRPLLEETEEGLVGSGEVAMQEAGAGAPLE